MGKALFVPLNTNHVLIFESIVRSLNCEYEVLCHDRISEAQQYQTQSILQQKKIPYRHFSKNIDRAPTDNLFLKIIDFFRMKNEIRNSLKHISPDVLVLAIDNDPIAQIFIKESKRQGIQTLLIQEALIRPHEHSIQQTYRSDYFYNLLRLFGIYLSYTKYATGNCNRMLVGGKIPSQILQEMGVPANKIAIVGHPRYDALIEKIQKLQPGFNEGKVYLFAASTKIVQDDRNLRFMKELVECARKLHIKLVIKLHPRGSHEPAEIYNLIGSMDTSLLEIIKEGDDTFEILKRSDALITVSSTVVLEALMMDKECVLASYLAGESRLEYDVYNAIHSIESEDEIYNVIKNSMLSKKNYQNKKRLLEDELYKLDARAGQRAARYIESMVSGDT